VEIVQVTVRNRRGQCLLEMALTFSAVITWVACLSNKEEGMADAEMLATSFLRLLR